VARILALMDKPPDWFELVDDRPGHDVRYAIDASKLRAETGWTPTYRDIGAGLAQTIEWYRQHEQWWKAAKLQTR
jgi:dTDP-glucose 4,6-dehydratase